MLVFKKKESVMCFMHCKHYLDSTILKIITVMSLNSNFLKEKKGKKCNVESWNTLKFENYKSKTS